MIAIYGASVTQQKTGYAMKLKSKFKEEIKIFGYGGMHLSNAGICYIDKVIKEKPDYCFIDWFSTGYTETNQSTKDFIDTIIYKFTRINCKLIFLFFLNENHNNRLEFYSFCKEYLTSKEITFWDLNDFLRFSTKILRDYVHTTEYGGEKYSEIIFRNFEQKRDSIKLPEQIRKTKYNCISEKQINKIYTKDFKLNGNGEIIGFLLTIGPHSGIVKVVKKDHTYKVNTWDKWCHFNRKHFNIALKLEGDNVVIKTTDDTFDTSSCSDKSLNFNREKKKIILHSIYYIGTLKTKNSFFSECKSKMIFLNWKKSLIIAKIKKRATLNKLH